MVELGERNGTAFESLDRATKAIVNVLGEGYSERELLGMVTTVAWE